MKRTVQIILTTIIALMALHSECRGRVVTYTVDDGTFVAEYQYLGNKEVRLLTLKPSSPENAPQQVVLPSHEKHSFAITEIGDGEYPYVFTNYNGLREITLPNTLKRIGDNAFRFCRYLNDITLPENITSIGAYAFSDCSNLKEVNILCPITTLNDYTFTNCSLLTTIVLPPTLEKIGKGAFGGCNNLTTIVLPPILEKIEERAFYNCQNLTTIVLPPTLKKIEKEAFCKCESLTTIDLPESLDSIKNGAFADCKNLTSIHFGKMLTCIGDNAFSRCQSLSSITLPENLISIGDYAFSKCVGLTTDLHCPESLVKIGSYAFTDCIGLTHVELNEGLESIGGGAFYNSGLESIELPKSLIEFRLSAIGKTQVKHLYIPPLLTNLFETGERSANQFETIAVDPDNPVYDSRQGCNAIIETASNILKAGSKNVTIPYGIEIIDNYSCRDLGLTEVVIPNTVVTIGYQAFYGNHIRTLDIPPSVRTIYSGAFRGNDLEELTLHEGLEQIGTPNRFDYGVFSSTTTIKPVVIPSTVKGITNFGDAPSEIYCKATTPPVGSYYDYYTLLTCFGSSLYPIARTLYVPIGCGGLYMTSKFWNNFTNIEEYDFTAGIDDTVTDLQENGSAPIYDLSGRKVSDSPQRGIYIKNGKKYFVK